MRQIWWRTCLNWAGCWGFRGLWSKNWKNEYQNRTLIFIGSFDVRNFNFDYRWTGFREGAGLGGSESDEPFSFMMLKPSPSQELCFGLNSSWTSSIWFLEGFVSGVCFSGHFWTGGSIYGLETSSWEKIFRLLLLLLLLGRFDFSLLLICMLWFLISAPFSFSTRVTWAYWSLISGCLSLVLRFFWALDYFS